MLPFYQIRIRQKNLATLGIRPLLPVRFLNYFFKLFRIDFNFFFVVEKKKIEELTPEEIAHRERKAQRKEEVTREHDKIINEIEQSGKYCQNFPVWGARIIILNNFIHFLDQTCIGTALKNVYTLGHVGRFQKKLEKRIRHQEREIERMCAFHYSHFVDAIEELSSIQGDAFNLCKQVSDTNINLQTVGNEIKDRHKELLRYRRQQEWL